MASKNTYIKYASEAFYEPQNVYMEGNSKSEIMDKLRELGARRILFVCNKSIASYKNYEDLIRKYEARGFRCFAYKKNDGPLTDIEILDGLKVYREYNCDTIITIGGSYEIDLGKLISAMATNYCKTPSEFAGVNNIKRDISLLCCIVTNNSPSASQPYAEFLNSDHNKWMIALSSYLIPQLVVIDTEICQRVEKSVAIDGILTSLCIAVEAFLSPASDSNPRYKANAVISCQLLMNNLDKIINNPDDTFIRKSIAVGSYYAGLSSTHTGIGYTHMIIHAMLEKNCDVHGVFYLKLLSIVLRKTMNFYNERIAELSRELHLCSNSADEIQASEILIERFERICNQYSDYFVPLTVSRDEIKKLLDEIKKEGYIFELKKLPNSLFIEALEEISANE